MEKTIWNTQEMGKCISKLSYWWNVMYHKREIKWNALKNSGWHSGQTLDINGKVLVPYVKLRNNKK